MLLAGWIGTRHCLFMAFGKMWACRDAGAAIGKVQDTST